MPRTDVSALKAGDHLYEVSQYVVKRVRDDGSVDVLNTQTHSEFTFGKDVVQSTIYSTDQFEREVKMTRSEIAKKIETLGHSSFRVKFRKQVVSNDVADGLDGVDMGSQAKRRKLLKSLMEGVERTMHARLYRTEEFDASMEFGRYKVVDLEDYEKTRDEKRSSRLVDTRTVSELVVDNVRYFV